MLMDFRTVIQYLPAQFDPCVRLESSAFLARADMQLSIDAIRAAATTIASSNAPGSWDWPGRAVRRNGRRARRAGPSRVARLAGKDWGMRARQGKFLDQSFPSPEAEQSQSDFGQRQNQRGAQNEDAIFGRALSESAPFFRNGSCPSVIDLSEVLIGHGGIPCALWNVADFAENFVTLGGTDEFCLRQSDSPTFPKITGSFRVERALQKYAKPA